MATTTLCPATAKLSLSVRLPDKLLVLSPKTEPVLAPELLRTMWAVVTLVAEEVAYVSMILLLMP